MPSVPQLMDHWDIVTFSRAVPLSPYPLAWAESRTSNKLPPVWPPTPRPIDPALILKEMLVFDLDDLKATRPTAATYRRRVASNKCGAAAARESFYLNRRAVLHFTGAASSNGSVAVTSVGEVGAPRALLVGRVVVWARVGAEQSPRGTVGDPAPPLRGDTTE